MDRRTFLTAAGAAVVALTAKEADEDDGYQPPDWLRYSKTVYFDGYTPPVYPSLKDFDPRRLVQCALDVGGDTLRYQPIGYRAYYPSKVFPHHPELAGRDMFEETARECRRAGLHVYAYTGYGHPFMEIGWVDSHPEYADWVMRDAKGKPYGTYGYHYGWAERQKTCRLSDAYRAAIRQIVREYCSHDIDGVYFDAPSAYNYFGFCFCNSCRRNYPKFTGFDIERLLSPNDRAASIAWYEWAQHCTREDLLDFRKIIHGSGKFMLCHNANTWYGNALKEQYRIPDGFMVEHAIQIHERLMHGMLGSSMARPYKKLPQMYLGSYCVANFNQPPHLKPWAVHDANLEDGDEILMEGFANLASGGIPLYATLNRLYFGIGSGSAEPVKEVFRLMTQAEHLIKDSTPVARVSVVPTWGALQLWRTKRQTFNLEMSQALFLAMLDSGIAVDAQPSTEMSSQWLDSQKVIALCGASGVSPADVEMIAGWVKRGGSLLATYDTGLYDEAGEIRKDGGALRDVLGVELTGEPLPALPECYYRVATPHAALGDLSAGALIQGDNRSLPVRVRPGAKVLAQCLNLGTGESRGPAIVANEYGQGRAIYINGSPELNYPYSRVRSQRRLLASLVHWLARGEPLPFRIEAPTGVFGVLRQSSNQDLVLWVLAPVGFKDASIGRMRQEFLPLKDVEVAIRIPAGRSAHAVHLVRAGHEIQFSVKDGYVVTTIPALHIAEMVHVQIRQA